MMRAFFGGALIIAAVAGAPALAGEVIFSFAGTVGADGIDNNGIFGTAGGSLSGLPSAFGCFFGIAVQHVAERARRNTRKLLSARRAFNPCASAAIIAMPWPCLVLILPKASSMVILSRSSTRKKTSGGTGLFCSFVK